MALFKRKPQPLTVAYAETANTDLDTWPDTNPRRMPAPHNIVTDEEHYQDPIRAHVKAHHQWPRWYQRGTGHLIPVAVTFTRDPDNPNTWKATINGEQIGWLAPDIAAAATPAMDTAGCGTFTIGGLIRGGSGRAPTLGVHVWPDRRMTSGPDIRNIPTTYQPPWPPWLNEGRDADQQIKCPTCGALPPPGTQPGDTITCPGPLGQCGTRYTAPDE